MAIIRSSIPERISKELNAGIIRGGHLIAGVEVSVLVNESHTFTSQASRVPLESGAVLTDHVIHEPDSLSVTFAMSNAGDGPQNARDVMESFKKMKDESTLLEIVTEHATYSNMVITGLSPVHSSPFRGALECTMTLQRVSFVKLAVVGRQPAAMTGTDAKVFSPQTNAGKQSPVDNRTAWAQITDAIVSMARGN